MRALPIELEKFMEQLIHRVPAEQQPFVVLLSKEEVEEVGKGRGYLGPHHQIRFHEKEHWYLEQEYRNTIERLESKVINLEAELDAARRSSN